MSDQKIHNQRYFLRLLEIGPFERRPRGGWRFGTKIISDAVVEQLLAFGHAEISGTQLKLKQPELDPSSFEPGHLTRKRSSARMTRSFLQAWSLRSLQAREP
jgi:hypothetical protein